MYDMTNSELIVQLESLLTEETEDVTISAELLRLIIDGLNDDITLLTEGGDELARFTGDTALELTRAALETYVFDSLMNSVHDQPMKRLEVLSETGHGRLSQWDAQQLLKRITRDDAVGTIVMGGEAHDIVKRSGE